MKKLVITVLLALIGSAVTWAQIRLFVVNDMGRNGYYEQRPIAELMGQMAERDGVEAVLALGDTHHFMGVESVQDPLWQTNYELVYSHPELMVPWYPILGNHEYRGNTQAVLDYSRLSRRWQFPARYYSRVLTENSVSVRIVFIDTTPLIDKYRQDVATYPDAREQSVKEQLRWLDRELACAREDWVVVVGHHPIYADTSKDTSERLDMQQRVNPILLRHHVPMYICGHIHNFQHIRTQEDGPDYIVNSAASLARNKVAHVEGTVFTSTQAGFSVLTCTSDMLRLDFIDSKGATIHSVVRTK